MVTVHKKDGSHLDEIMILDLHAPYTIVHQKDDKATLDIHIKTKDAVKLLKGLKETLMDVYNITKVELDTKIG